MVDLQCCVSFRYKIETFLYMVYIYPYNCIFCYIYIHTHTYVHITVYSVIYTYTHTHTHICVYMHESQVASVLSNSLQLMNCSLPGSSVHGILQARMLEWVAMPSSRESSEPGIKPASLMSPTLADGFFTISSIWEAYIWGFFGIHIYTLLYTK